MIAVENLTVSYRQKPAVHHVDIHFEEGSMWAVFGPNGAGKSTLLKAVMRLLECTTGSVSWQVCSGATSPICRSRPTSTAASR